MHKELATTICSGRQFWRNGRVVYCTRLITGWPVKPSKQSRVRQFESDFLRRSFTAFPAPRARQHPRADNPRSGRKGVNHDPQSSHCCGGSDHSTRFRVRNDHRVNSLTALTCAPRGPWQSIAGGLPLFSPQITTASGVSQEFISPIV